MTNNSKFVSIVDSTSMVWKMLLSVILLGFGTTTLTLARYAHAEEGRLPILEVGVMSGLTFSPFEYEYDSPFGTAKDSESTLGIPLGPRASLHWDMGNVVLSIDGSYNVLPTGARLSPLHYSAGVSVLIGGRATMGLRQVVSSERKVTRSGDYEIIETRSLIEIHEHKRVPLVYGLHLGARGVSVREAVLKDQGTRPEFRKPAALSVAPEVGFGVLAGQIEVLVAGAYEVRKGLPSIRWITQGAPEVIGSCPLSFRLEGQHFFGSPADVALSHVLLFGVAVGTSIGVTAQ